MAEEKKKARIMALALQEVIGSGGFTAYAAPQEGEEVEEPHDLPEGVEVEDQTQESVAIRDPYTNQETDQEQEIHLFKVSDHNRLFANMAHTGTKPASGEAAGAEGEKKQTAQAGAEKKTPRSENADS